MNIRILNWIRNRDYKSAVEWTLSDLEKEVYKIKRSYEGLYDDAPVVSEALLEVFFAIDKMRTENKIPVPSEYLDLKKLLGRSFKIAFLTIFYLLVAKFLGTNVVIILILSTLLLSYETKKMS